MVRVQTRGGTSTKTKTAKHKTTFVKTTAKLKAKTEAKAGAILRKTTSTNATVKTTKSGTASGLGKTKAKVLGNPESNAGGAVPKKKGKGKGNTALSSASASASQGIHVNIQIDTPPLGHVLSASQQKAIKTYASKSKTKAKDTVTFVSKCSATKSHVVGHAKKSAKTVRAVLKSANTISRAKETRTNTIKSKSGNKHTTITVAKKIASKSTSRDLKTAAARKTTKSAHSTAVPLPLIKSGEPTKPDLALGTTAPNRPKVPKKEYMTAGFYCQDPHPSVTRQLVNQVLRIRSAESKANIAKQKLIASSLSSASSSAAVRATRTRVAEGASAVAPGKGQSPAVPIIADRLSFPPLPYDHGYDLFFHQQHDFELPFNIRFEAENGLLVRKAKPTAFQKLRGNVYPERPRVSAGSTAVCRCSPESGCGDNCINRIMSYLCGKECPAGEQCTNKTLTKRKGPGYKVVNTGARGFGVVLTEDVGEGEFVMDYRGEVISMETFMDRIQDEYKGSKNFYALEYDQDEVIDAGMRGNDARFINHGCAPNLEVRKYQTLGDGWEEYEVGMWALRDIKAGEELFYDYNFESFGVAAQSDELRTKCCCGAPNCVGFLGRKAGEKSAKELAAELAAQLRARTKKSKKSKARKTQQGPGLGCGSRLVTAVLGLEAEGTPSDTTASTANPSPELQTPSESSEKVLDEIEVAPSLDTPTVLPIIEAVMKAKGKRKSEAFAKEVDSLRGDKKKCRKSEPIPRPTIKGDLPAVVSKVSKEAKVKARNGAPKGWAYVLPGAEDASKPAVVATRRPPRDRSSLG
ncbi:hypothetical protein IAU59_004829 [Kwoniella sp. CBS 9459]